MQGSVSQPDLCLYVSAIQAFKAHQPQAAHAEPVAAQPTDSATLPGIGHPVLRPRWLAWLVPSASR